MFSLTCVHAITLDKYKGLCHNFPSHTFQLVGVDKDVGIPLVQVSSTMFYVKKYNKFTLMWLLLFLSL